jgi:conjugative transfer pilus assembly protein TraH
VPAAVISGAVLLFALVAPSARADWVSDFYSSAGAGVNVTYGQAVHSRNMSGYSGGSISWRVPQKNLQPFAVTPPSFKAGCNGIDFFTGAFSFPNAEQFVQALRNFGQAALGSLFMSALKWISPVIASTVEFITDLVNKVNQFSIDGCRAGTTLGTKLGDSVFGAISQGAASGNAQGAESDYVASLRAVQENFDKGIQWWNKTVYGATNPGALNRTQVFGKEAHPASVNFIWYALNHSDRTANLSRENKEVIMSLVGTFIRRPKNDSSGDMAPGKAESLLGVTTYKQVLGTDRSQAGLYTCANYGNYDAEKFCLSVTANYATHDGFIKKYGDLYEKLRAAVAAKSAPTLNAAEKDLLRMTSVPLWRIAAMQGTPGVAAAVAAGQKDSLIYYAALDATMGTVNYFLTDLQKALDGSTAELVEAGVDDQFKVQDLKGRIVRIRQEMQDELGSYVAANGNPLDKIEMVNHAERAMYASLSSHLAANWAFSGGLR